MEKNQKLYILILKQKSESHGKHYYYKMTKIKKYISKIRLYEFLVLYEGYRCC